MDNIITDSFKVLTFRPQTKNLNNTSILLIAKLENSIRANYLFEAKDGNIRVYSVSGRKNHFEFEVKKYLFKLSYEQKR